jgi:thiosulfate/3-mercaptopyruvate sulfurtransferase
MHPLITTAALATELDRPAAERPSLIDVRFALGGPPGTESYEKGHLPGAVYLDLETSLAGEPGAGGRHPLPAPGALQQSLRVAGVRRGHPVVIYDDADGSAAARAWWLLRWAGHTDVRVLDGGFAAWAEEGRPVSTETATAEPGDFEVVPGAMPVLDADQAARLARGGVLLDARVPERYAGETEPVDPRAGHIPGAVNAPFPGHLGPDGRWKSPAELARRFAELGVDPQTPVGTYCGSGITASSVVLALEAAGREDDAALYTGSWSHWSQDPDRPVATGHQPG